MPAHPKQQQSSPSRTRRVFFAIPAQAQCREELVHATRKAMRASGGRPVLPADLHITLAFVGSVPEEKIALLQAAGAALSGAPFVLRLDRMEHWARPQILCAASSAGSAAGDSLVRALRSRLEEHGFKLDLHPWKPHVTLARNVLRPHLVGPMTPVSWPAPEFGLFESVGPPQVPRYRAIESWPLSVGS